MADLSGAIARAQRASKEGVQANFGQLLARVGSIEWPLGMDVRANEDAGSIRFSFPLLHGREADEKALVLICRPGSNEVTLYQESDRETRLTGEEFVGKLVGELGALAVELEDSSGGFALILNSLTNVDPEA